LIREWNLCECASGLSFSLAQPISHACGEGNLDWNLAAGSLAEEKRGVLEGVSLPFEETGFLMGGIPADRPGESSEARPWTQAPFSPSA